MKILLAAHHFPPVHASGAELLAHRTARWLIDHGHTVRVVCVEAIDDSAAGTGLRCVQDSFDGIPVQRLFFNLAASPDPLRSSFDHPLIEENLTNELSTWRPDVLYLVSGYLIGIAPLRAAKKFGVPTVVMLTDFWFLCPTLQLVRGDGSLCAGPEPLECARCLYDRQRRYRWLDQSMPGVMQNFWRMASQHPVIGQRVDLSTRLETLTERKELLRETLSSVDAIVSPTRFVADMHTANRVNAAHITINPYSVALPRPIPAESDPILRVGYLGQIVPIKGVHLLVQAFHRLNRSKRRARLTIHGKLEADPRYVHDLKRLAEGDADIVFAGAYQRDELARVLSELDVVVVPSIWYENAPQVILESFAAHKPVIGTDVGGIAEVVQHGVNGLLFERKNVADLTRQLQRALDEPGLLARLSNEIPAMRTVDEEMSELFKVFEQVVANQTTCVKEIA